MMQNPSSFNGNSYNLSSSRIVVDRGSFLVKTYLNLTLAIFAFIAIETVLFGLFSQQVLATLSHMGPRWVSLVMLLLCLGCSVAGAFVLKDSLSLARQYCVLGLYVLLESLIFVPILAVAIIKTGGMGIVIHAAVGTALLASLLSVTVFMTRQNFSFLRPLLWFSSLAALVFVVLSLLFGFNLGNLFAYLMIVLACGYILYDTGKVMDHSNDQTYVLAAAELFISVMMLFYYILIALLRRN